MDSFRQIYRSQRATERESKAQQRREAQERFNALPPETQRKYQLIAGAILVLGIGVIVLITVLSGRDDPAATPVTEAETFVDDAAAVETPEYGADPIQTTAAEPVSSSLSRPEACAEFYRITSTLTYDDNELALHYHGLASRTADPLLANEIRKVGDAFERHDSAVPSTGVAAYC